jgi:HEAT repeat protein
MRAAVALQQPDIMRSGLEVAAAAPALLATLEARADGLRIESLKALGRAADGPGRDVLRGSIARLTDIYGTQDPELEKNHALRAAFVYAIGMVDPTTEASIAILKKALAHSDAGVRAAAAGAVGAWPTIPSELLAAYQAQQRLDARAAGAGAE